jgi:hypothetical protein
MESIVTEMSNVLIIEIRSSVKAVNYRIKTDSCKGMNSFLTISLYPLRELRRF